MKRSRETDDHEDTKVAVDDHEDTQVAVGGHEDTQVAVDADSEAMRDYWKCWQAEVCQKPAASILEQPSAPMFKRPSASIAADDSDEPTQPPLKTRLSAIRYKGCVIEYGSQQSYGVLYADGGPRRYFPKGSRRRYFCWSTAEDAADVWAQVIAFLH